MKKILFTLLSLTAVVACTKSETIYSPDSEIGLTAVNSKLTKAAVQGTALPNGSTILTYGYYKDDVQSGEPLSNFKSNTTTPTTYINGATFKHMTDFTLWHGDPVAYYWPKVGSMVFAGITDTTAVAVAGASFDYTTDAWSIFDYVQPANTAQTKDLMYSNLTSTSVLSQNVNMTFKHTMSWISFGIQGDDDAKSAYTINSITLKDVVGKGTLSTANADNLWTLSADTTDKNDVAVVSSNTPLDGHFKYLEDNANGTLVLPQTAKIVEIVYTLTAGGTELQHTFTYDLGGLTGEWKDTGDQAVTGEPLNTWKPGRHYTYLLEFSLNEIKIAPTVENWIERSYGAIPVQ